MLRNVLFGSAGAATLFVAYHATVGVAPPPQSLPVPSGKTRICVVGYSTVSPSTAHAHELADVIAKSMPQKFESWYYFSNMGWSSYCVSRTKDVEFPSELKGHSTSPFVFLEEDGGAKTTPIGGDSQFSAWALKQRDFADSTDVLAAAKKPAAAALWHGWNRPMTAKSQ